MRKLSLGIAAALAFSTLTLAQQQPAPQQQQQQQQPPPPPAVKVGEAAPDFTLSYFNPLGDGKFEPKKATLSDFKGKQNVVLAFFPAAFSPGCTKELQEYRKQTSQLTGANTQILGISVDSTWSNKAFREQLGADFPILSDWKKEVSRKYGILDENSGFARRTTFVIDKNGVIQKIDQGSDALDPSGVVGMCQKMSKSTM